MLVSCVNGRSFLWIVWFAGLSSLVVATTRRFQFQYKLGSLLSILILRYQYLIGSISMQYYILDAASVAGCIISVQCNEAWHQYEVCRYAVYQQAVSVYSLVFSIRVRGIGYHQYSVSVFSLSVSVLNVYQCAVYQYTVSVCSSAFISISASVLVYQYGLDLCLHVFCVDD